MSLDEVIHVMNRAMTPEQFVQVVDAILAGKYSWACVLILRFAGYNPLHYIPYRTYNRLMKEHCPAFHRRREEDQNSCDEGRSIQDPTRKITDLSYLDSLDNRQSQARGGTHTCMIYSFIHSL